MDNSISNQESKAVEIDCSNIFLMAEDNPADAELFSEMLGQAFGSDYAVVCVDCFEKTVDALANGTFEALILDMNLPDRSGVENISLLGERYPELPIVVLTGNEDLDTAVDSLQKGAQDYLTKNRVTPEVLVRSLRYAKERKHIEQRLKLALGDLEYQNVQLEALVKHDPLTRLPNRTYFHEAATRVLHRAERSKKKVALLYCDLNDFKKVNDTFGHIAGDELLKRVSKRLLNVVRDSDFLARLGGDEFVIITDVLDSKQDVYSVVKRITAEFEDVFVIDGHEIPVVPSIGISYYPDADSLDLLVKQADCAMYEAKQQKNSSICFYTQQMAAQFSRNQKIELELGSAIEKGEITTWFQPVVSMHDSNAILVEALVRWNSDSLGWVAPNEFIPIAESSPVINDITHCVTRDSARLFHSLEGLKASLNKVAINVSASQLGGDHFCSLFMRWLNDLKLPPETVCIELTEREVVQNARKCGKQMEKLRDFGVRVALDDFGSGYSSVTHLLDLPLDILKLDRVLMRHIDRNPRNQALAAGIVEMAKRIGMLVVAEGVEREEEYLMAKSLGCDFVQGYYFSKPMTLEETLLYYGLQV